MVKVKTHLTLSNKKKKATVMYQVKEGQCDESYKEPEGGFIIFQIDYKNWKYNLS